jgi:hypothetical protein
MSRQKEQVEAVEFGQGALENAQKPARTRASGTAELRRV